MKAVTIPVRMNEGNRMKERIVAGKRIRTEAARSMKGSEKKRNKRRLRRVVKKLKRVMGETAWFEYIVLPQRKFLRKRTASSPVTIYY
jgi:hypothetical protein